MPSQAECKLCRRTSSSSGSNMKSLYLDRLEPFEQVCVLQEPERGCNMLTQKRTAL